MELRDIIETAYRAERDLCNQLNSINFMIKSMQVKKNSSNSVQVKLADVVNSNSCDPQVSTNDSNSKNVDKYDILHRVDKVLEKASQLKVSDSNGPVVLSKRAANTVISKNTKYKSTDKKSAVLMKPETKSFTAVNLENVNKAEKSRLIEEPRNLDVKKVNSKYVKLCRHLRQLNEASTESICPSVNVNRPSDNMNLEKVDSNLVCIYKIFDHLLTVYIVPGTFDHDRIHQIFSKTYRECSKVIEQSHLTKSHDVAQALRHNRISLQNYHTQTINQKLKVFAFSKKLQILGFLEKYTQLLESRAKIMLLNNAIVFLSDENGSKSVKERLKRIQLVSYILEDTMFVPPVVY